MAPYRCDPSIQKIGDHKLIVKYVIYTLLKAIILILAANL